MYNTKAYSAASATSPLASTKIKRRDATARRSPWRPTGYGGLASAARRRGLRSTRTLSIIVA